MADVLTGVNVGGGTFGFGGGISHLSGSVQGRQVSVVTLAIGLEGSRPGPGGNIETLTLVDGITVADLRNWG